MTEPVILPRTEHDLSRRRIDENSLKVLYRLQQHGYKAYLVGGGVRDLLLGRQPKDFDIGTDATPEQIRKLFRNCRLIGRRFRLAHILFGDNERIEVATFRRKPLDAEVPDDDPFFCENQFGTPEQDAFRRDFTINALFYNIEDFSIIDYVGGLEDLRLGRIRVIGDADERFVEDPVRMLRALEFAARLGFELDDAIAPAIGRRAGGIALAAPARLREEVLELFRHKVAGKVLQKADRYGLLADLLPDLQPSRELFDLLRQVDVRTASGAAIDESLALAALYLPAFRQRLVEGSLAEVFKQANALLVPHCQRYSIACGIRHQARELLVGFYRFTRGRGHRGEQRFLRHPAAAQAFVLFQLWWEASRQEGELLESWRRALAGEEAPAAKVGAPGRRRPRRRGGRRRSKKTAAPAPE
ncbi:MAG: polynucleotide adenylyltransferase PcnB [Desulfuromonas sp.]|uniref:polynucleotide adenylyltransferase PcnB n=1 Tax=Desulfuromonas thiophila TaxID=57664 RepID=UPI0024A94C1D|nr:polynucleotide adenylyltransferase PcnB [Desulfuromonas thiophila]